MRTIKTNNSRAFAERPAMAAMTMAPAIALGLLFPATTSAANHVVTALSNMTFSPKALTINAGDTVTFKNGGGFHNVASDPGAVTAFRCAAGCDGAGGNGDLSSSTWSATVAFPTAGTAAFHCEAHGAAGGIGMSGTITVKSVPVQKRRYDFNGDGKSDILWRNGSTGANSIWLSANSATKQAVASLLDLAWTVVGSGDYNGDGRADIQWRNGATGANSYWPSANQAMKQVLTAQPDLAWSVVGTVE